MFVLFSGQRETSENCKQGSQMIRFGIFERSPRRSIHTQLHPPTLKVGLCSYPDAENDFFFQEPEIREVVHAQGGEGTSSPCVGVNHPSNLLFCAAPTFSPNLSLRGGRSKLPSMNQFVSERKTRSFLGCWADESRHNSPGASVVPKLPTIYSKPTPPLPLTPILRQRTCSDLKKLET